MGTDTYFEAVNRAIVANEEICQQYKADFNAQVANPDFQPHDNRMAELERLWHRAKTDADAVYARLTEDLIGGIDEKAVIESKKESTGRRG